MVSACSVRELAPSSLPTSSASAAPTASISPTAERTPDPTPVPEAPTPAPTIDPVALASVSPGSNADRPIGAACSADDFSAFGLNRAMTFAAAPIEVWFQTGSPRDGSAGGWSDSVPGPTIRYAAGFAGHAVVAAANTVAALQPGETITLLSGGLEIYPLDANDRVDEDGRPVATADTGAVDGGLLVPVPAGSGRWLLTVGFSWQSDCQEGGGYVDLLLETT